MPMSPWHGAALRSHFDIRITMASARDTLSQRQLRRETQRTTQFLGVDRGMSLRRPGVNKRRFSLLRITGILMTGAAFCGLALLASQHLPRWYSEVAQRESRTPHAHVVFNTDSDSVIDSPSAQRTSLGNPMPAAATQDSLLTRPWSKILKGSGLTPDHAMTLDPSGQGIWYSRGNLLIYSSWQQLAANTDNRSEPDSPTNGEASDSITGLWTSQRYLIVACADGSIQCSDRKALLAGYRTLTEARLGSARITGASHLACILPAEAGVVIGGRDGLISHLRLPTLEAIETRSVREPVRDLALNERSAQLAVLGEDGGLQFVNSSSLLPVNRQRLTLAPQSFFASFGSEDEAWIVSKGSLLSAPSTKQAHRYTLELSANDSVCEVQAFGEGCVIVTRNGYLLRVSLPNGEVLRRVPTGIQDIAHALIDIASQQAFFVNDRGDWQLWSFSDNNSVPSAQVAR